MVTPKLKKNPPKPVIGIWDALNGTRYPFAALGFDGVRKTRIAIGRSRECEIQVGDAWVSMNHCEVEWQDSQVVLRDTSSTNGTEIDQRRVDSDVTLKPDMYIAIGASLLVTVAEDEWPQLRSRTHSSFLRNSKNMYGNDRKAAKKIRKGRSTIQRAVNAKKENE